ncbi:alcohol dehydrogenase catalytic domain-containing protein [Microbacterium sp. NPDC055903]
MRTLLPHAQLRDIALRPAASARVWLGSGQALERVAVPGVGLAAGDVLVAVELSTICGDDVRVACGDRTSVAPAVLGHESVGRVIALGEGGARTVEGTELRVGDRVVWTVAVSCGDCDRCRAGLPQACRSLAQYGRERLEPRWELTGGFASHVHLRKGTSIVRVPESLPAAVLAPASCATATAWAAVAKTGRDLEGARVRVFGAGLLGLTAAAIAADRGARVDIVEPVPHRRALAAGFGADAERTDELVDVAIETSGHAVAEAIDAVDMGGTVVLLASASPSPAIVVPADSLVRRLVTVTGVHGSTGTELSEAVAFLAGRGRAFAFADAVGAVFPLEQADAAVAAASSPDAPLRVGLVPR